MCYLERFDIDLKALTDEVTPLSWELDDQFFASLEGAQLQGGSLHVSGSIRKATGFYELQLHTDGTVRIPCDRCLDMMDQPIGADLRLVAVPIQHVHQPGDCNDAMMRVLEEHSAARSSDADAKEIDPRWSALLKLKEKSEE